MIVNVKTNMDDHVGFLVYCLCKKMYINKINEKFENSIAKYYISNYNEFKNS